MSNRLFVLLPEATKREAKAKAAHEGLTLSDLVRGWLLAWLAGELQPAREKQA